MGDILLTYYTDSVPLVSEKKREKILTFGPLEVLFTSPIQAQGTAGRRTKKITRDGRLRALRNGQT